MFCYQLQCTNLMCCMRTGCLWSLLPELALGLASQCPFVVDAPGVDGAVFGERDGVHAAARDLDGLFSAGEVEEGGAVLFDDVVAHAELAAAAVAPEKEVGGDGAVGWVGDWLQGGLGCALALGRRLGGLLGCLALLGRDLDRVGMPW